MDPSYTPISDEESLDLEQGPDLVLPQVGEVIEDKYAITKLIGEGGMGVVFEALHLRLGQLVALKFLHPAALLVPGAVERFEREARASAQLRGAHVAHVIDVDVTKDGASFMVMELLRGRDLEGELRDRGPLPIEEAVDIVLQICSAMAEAHQSGIVHRDLKPSNVFLAEENGDRVVKVLDFGISLIARPDTARVTSTSVSLGTPLYMSPEQVRCSKRVDARTDLWSIGVILYELLAGEPPFVGEATAAVAAIVADETPSVRQRRGDVPVALDAIIARALAKDVHRRYQTAEELSDALAPFGSGRYRMSQPPSKRARALARTWLAWPPPRRIALSTNGSGAARSGRLPRRSHTILAVVATLIALPAITFAGFGRGGSSITTRPVEGAACREPSVTTTTAGVLDTAVKIESNLAAIHAAAAPPPPPDDVIDAADAGAALELRSTARAPRPRARTVAEPPSKTTGAPPAPVKIDNPLYL